MHYWLVMPAAGAGRRFGGAKQHAALGERTVLEVALQPFLGDARCAGGCIALTPSDPMRPVLESRLPARFALVDGGGERVHSVRNALGALATRASGGDWVLVHDAARPCLSAADLSRLVEAGAVDAVGALLASRVADTVKRAAGGTEGSGAGAARCAQTVPRDGLWLAQTPQMFRYAALHAALEAALAAGRVPTDEAQAMEWQGGAALLVQAHEANPKITSAADLPLARAILASRQETDRG